MFTFTPSYPIKVHPADPGPIANTSTSLVPRADGTDAGAASDSNTITIIFGTIGAVLAFASIVVGIVFGIAQIRKRSNIARSALDDIEMNPPQRLSAAGVQDDGSVEPT